MKIVIFAGGSGRRLWPISLKSSPKQFEPIIGSRSTLQLAVDRVKDTYGAENIFISTNEMYIPIIQKQLPELPVENLIGEPTRRDLAPAVGLAMAHVAQKADPAEPVAILWGDNYMTEVPTFLTVLAAAEDVLRQGAASIMFVGETARFANDNLGWIGLGEPVEGVTDRPVYKFDSFWYRPPMDECQKMYASGRYVWNTGYFVTTPGYVRALYATHQPDMWAKLTGIEAKIGADAYKEALHDLYPQMDTISFDDAILTHVPHNQALVLHGNMGWSDPGTLYALKEAINPDPVANVSKGQVVTHDSKDCLVYNYESGKLVAAVGLEGMIVVNTAESVLVVHKDNIKLVKAMVDGLVGTDLEKYT